MLTLDKFEEAEDSVHVNGSCFGKPSVHGRDVPPGVSVTVICGGVRSTSNVPRCN